MRWARGLGLLVIAVVLAASSRDRKAFRPFDGTDAAVAEHGKVEVELGPAEYLRERTAHTRFAPSTRFNYGFAPDWEAVVEGRVAHGLSDRVHGTSLMWSAVFIPGIPSAPNGFEIQIDNTGAPDGAGKHRTGAVYAVNYPGDPNPDPALPAAQPGDFVNPQNARVLAWNQYRIELRGDVISVNLNGVDTARYTNTDPNRGPVYRGRADIRRFAVILEL